MASLPSLIEADRAGLVEIFGATPFTVASSSDDHVRVVADSLTIHFYRRVSDGLIHSSLELASVPAHKVPLANHLHTWMLLKSRGEDWPETQSADPLGAELTRLARALPMLRDETILVESLLWEAGYLNGFAAHAVPWD
jgi:hypothetical protein